MKQLKEKHSRKPREKKIVFSEQIDDAISGYSIGITFILISLFFFWNNTYLIDEEITQIAGAIIGILGLCGVAMQLSESAEIKGFDNLGMGLSFVVFWFIGYVRMDCFWANLLLILPLLFGVFGTVRGLIEIAYSFVVRIILNKGDKPKTTRTKEGFLLVTQVFGLILTILNILKIFDIVGN